VVETDWGFPDSGAGVEDPSLALDSPGTHPVPLRMTGNGGNWGLGHDGDGIILST